MKKESLDDVINDLRSRRDCLSLAHESIKAKSDQYNKVIIILSLVTGCVESMKIQMGWNNNAVAMIPIFMSSIIGMISALCKFEDFPNKMETLVQAISLLTATLLKARNHTELDDELLQEYHSSLQANETSLYPDIRKKYLKDAHKNLLCIMKQEQMYYENIKKVNAGEKLTIKCDSSSDTSSENVIINNKEIELEEVDEMDTLSHRREKLETINELHDNL